VKNNRKDSVRIIKKGERRDSMQADPDGKKTKKKDTDIKITPMFA
jgi:hypothetical protein